VFGTAFVDDYRVGADDVPDPVNPLGVSCAAPGVICGPNGLNERDERDRGGWGSGVGISHVIALPVPGLPTGAPSLSGGYAFTSFSADGLEYGHDAHRFFLGLGIRLLWGVGLDLEGSYTNRIFDHPSTFPDQDAIDAAATAPNHQYRLSGLRRREHAFAAESRVSIPLPDPFSVTAYYRYRDNISTSDVFDYDQHVVGLVFNVSFSRAQ